MEKITTLFWDIGGVILTNGWDFPSRKKAAQKFGFDFDEFETEHMEVEGAFETGRLNLDEYLNKTLFLQARPFNKDEVKEFMFSLPEPNLPTIEIVKRFASSRRYLLAAINNESLELNLYRIEKFHLRDYFTGFFSSCFLNMRKPSQEIYDKALQITQRNPSECVFIDDREENLVQARALGMITIHYENSHQLSRELQLRLDV